MNTFFTSDTHFGHDNIIKYCPDTRGHFTNTDEMDNAIIESWNSVVKVNDEVYHNGDFGWGNYKTINKILSRLNGQVHIMIGNHDDKRVLNKAKFSSVQDVKYIKRNGINIFMSHYPHVTWDKAHYGCIHLFGHMHGTSLPWQHPLSLDVGIDNNNFKLFTLEDIMKVGENHVINN